MFEIRHEDTRISFVVTDNGLLINLAHHNDGYAITLGPDETERLIAALTPTIPQLKANAIKAEEAALEKAVIEIQKIRKADEEKLRRAEEEAAKREAFKAELRAEIATEMDAEKSEGGGL